MKLPKYNMSYNTRDLIHSLAKSTCERKYDKVIDIPIVECVRLINKGICIQDRIEKRPGSSA